MKKRPVLIGMDHNQCIKNSEDRTFLETLQCALLLTLQERGILSDMQYRSAAQLLKAQQLVPKRKVDE